MADPTPTPAGPLSDLKELQAALAMLKSGGQTTEGKLSIGLTIAGIVLGFLMPILDQLGAAHPESHTLHLVIGAMALAVALLAATGHGKSRTDVKTAFFDLLAQIHTSHLQAQFPPSAAPVAPSPKLVTPLPDSDGSTPHEVVSLAPKGG